MAPANPLRRASSPKLCGNRALMSPSLASLRTASMEVSFGSRPPPVAYLRRKNWTCSIKTAGNMLNASFRPLSRLETSSFLIATTSQPWPIREFEASTLRKSAGPMRSSRHALTSFSFLNYHWILQWPELGSAMDREINLSEENLSNSAGRFFTL